MSAPDGHYQQLSFVLDRVFDRPEQHGVELMGNRYVEQHLFGRLPVGQGLLDLAMSSESRSLATFVSMSLLSRSISCHSVPSQVTAQT